MSKSIDFDSEAKEIVSKPSKSAAKGQPRGTFLRRFWLWLVA